MTSNKAHTRTNNDSSHTGQESEFILSKDSVEVANESLVCSLNIQSDSTLPSFRMSGNSGGTSVSHERALYWELLSRCLTHHIRNMGFHKAHGRNDSTLEAGTQCQCRCSRGVSNTHTHTHTPHTETHTHTHTHTHRDRVASQGAVLITACI